MMLFWHKIHIQDTCLKPSSFAVFLKNRIQLSKYCYLVIYKQYQNILFIQLLNMLNTVMFNGEIRLLNYSYIPLSLAKHDWCHPKNHRISWNRVNRIHFSYLNSKCNMNVHHGSFNTNIFRVIIVIKKPCYVETVLSETYLYIVNLFSRLVCRAR